MPLHYVSMPISHSLGGIKKSAFPEADCNLHVTISLEVKLLSVPSCQLSVSCRLLHVSETCLHLNYISIVLLLVFALCESFSLPVALKHVDFHYLSLYLLLG